MNPFFHVMTRAKCMWLFQNVRFVQNESILQHDVSCKVHFALAKCEVRAK